MSLIRFLYNNVIFFIKKLDKRGAKPQFEEIPRGKLKKPPRL